MIRQLQKRFIRIAVLALTIAMVLVVSIVNIANWISVRAELADTLNLLSVNSTPAVPGEGENSRQEPSFPVSEKETESSFRVSDREKDTDDMGGSDGRQSDRRDESSDQSRRSDQSWQSGQSDQSGFPGFWNEWGGFRNRHTRNMVSETNWFSAWLDSEGAIVGLSLEDMPILDEEAARELAQQALDTGLDTGYIGDYQFLVRHQNGQRTRIVIMDCETRLASVRTLAWISAIACLGGILLALVIVMLASHKAVEPTIRNIEQQKQFITNASHELKTPLTVISTNMELLNMETPDNPWVRSTQKQTSTLRRLVDELVYLSRMEEEYPAMSMESVPFASLLEETAEPFIAMAEFAGKEMKIKADPALKVTGDRPSLQRLVSTLCDNAVKYTPEGGSILAEAYGDGRNAVFRVSNTVETPLTKEQCNQLFLRFYRADPSRNKGKQSGFGIGLSIAAAIAEKHGGSIRAAMDGDRLVLTCTLTREKI